MSEKQQQGKVKFVRIRGRIVPIKSDKQYAKSTGQTDWDWQTISAAKKEAGKARFSKSEIRKEKASGAAQGGFAAGLTGALLAGRFGKGAAIGAGLGALAGAALTGKRSLQTKVEREAYEKIGEARQHNFEQGQLKKLNSLVQKYPQGGSYNAETGKVTPMKKKKKTK
jgi:hypothetical protein